MAVAITIKSRSFDQNTEIVRGTLTFTGNYVALGDIANLDAVIAPIGEVGIFSNGLPLSFWITGINGYDYVFIAGTNQANGKIKVLTTAAAELPVAAYPAGILGDTVTFEASFPKAA